MYRIERKILLRGGPHDFRSASPVMAKTATIRCRLPIDQLESSQKHTPHAAYRCLKRVAHFQCGLDDCFRQQRFPELLFGSDASIALTMFLARNANGAAFDAPAIKR